MKNEMLIWFFYVISPILGLVLTFVFNKFASRKDEMK